MPEKSEKEPLLHPSRPVTDASFVPPTEPVPAPASAPAAYTTYTIASDRNRSVSGLSTCCALSNASSQCSLSQYSQMYRTQISDEYDTVIMHNYAKQMKAQHLESFDYDMFESRVNLKHDRAIDSSKIYILNFSRWVMTFCIGLCTALVACFIEKYTLFFSTFRITTMSRILSLERANLYPFGTAYATNMMLCLSFNAIAAYCVAILCPIAAGSGISEIKATLNGIKIHRVVRLKTLACKVFGILFSVAAGLPVGKEGPMIHSGAILGAGLSQGKSSSFGIDTSWTKFKGFRNDKEKRDFISCGAAAGVTAAFGAPIGGVLFALEEGASFWHQNLTWRTFFCAMIAVFIFNLFSNLKGYEEDTNIMPMDGVLNSTNVTTVALSAFSSKYFGIMGTQSGTFSFGIFHGSVSRLYSLTEVFIFILMGCFGGLWGALYNHMNTKLTKWRLSCVTNKWVKFGEALLVGATMTTVTFWASYYFGKCYPRPELSVNPYTNDLMTFYCEENEYNDLASLFTVSYSTSIKQLLHFSSFSFSSSSSYPDAAPPMSATTFPSFSLGSLLAFFLIFSCMSCWTYGISVPSGLFIPSLVSGAALGRVFIYLLRYFGFQMLATDGMYALIGAASILGGMARMTISLTVIILECTGVLEWGLPIMLCLMAARWIGNLFNEGLYDIHIHLRKLPFLEFDPPYYSKYLRVKNIMTKDDVIALGVVVQVGDVYDILSRTTHSGFPVVDEPQDGDGEAKFAGMILRKQLCVLLKKKDFFDKKPIPYKRKPVLDMSTSNSGDVLTYRELESKYPRYPQIYEIMLDVDEENMWMDLTPYMNPTPHTVVERTPVARAFRLFRSLGLRHMAVLSRSGFVRGMITRKDLTPEHLKSCLKSLSAKEKHRIQDYFRRTGRHESFETVEQELLRVKEAT